MRQPGSQQNRTPTPPPQDGPRINERIRATEVRVISDSGEQLGILAIRDALAKAEEYGLDLVEVSEKAWGDS